ncbi:Glutathione synthetase [Phytophthora cinnamomi]|uniref:Glutathione synthetase n=1 Tax=Phytophthora cinnamomi TaxID=4785 RepID=UPI0035594FAC|nr:Glutathione synthetase [Phytophthora cinnamomi]
MEDFGAARSDDSEPRSLCSDQQFHVVYDPRFDRFFLEDDALHRDRNSTLDRKDISIPWDKWVLPPKSPSKSEQQDKPTALQQGEEDRAPVPALNPAHMIVNKSTESTIEAQNVEVHGKARLSKRETPVPELDLTKMQQQLAEVSMGTPLERAKPKKTRIPDYNAHFQRTYQDMAKFIVNAADNAEPSDEHEVKCNGEVIRVQVPGLQPTTKRSVPNDTVGCNALEPERLHGATEEQWPGSTYELKNLMRIRAHADGLRRVNSACRFVAVSSSESSDSEEEQEVPPQQESEEESELMPVFFRDDRVLFHAKRRWFKGTVRRRIPRSDFYNVRADNGTLLEAVLASKMELLDEPEEVPYYHYTRGDKVLWIPDSTEAFTHNSTATTATRRNRRRRGRTNNSDEELTYKAKIVQVRSLDQFDVLLRTGRVVKVPYEQLRPRDASDFVSTTTPRRR